MANLLTKTHYGLLLVAMLGLSACSGGAGVADLEQYVATIKGQKGGRIEPLPEIKPYKTYLYSVQKTRSPFELPEGNALNAKTGAESSGKGLHPDFYRKKEPLEQFPLDSLKMVGIMEKDKALWGLVQTKDTTIHKVQVGNYIGQNHGKIMQISEDKVSLLELIQDADGGWVEREAAVSIGEEE